MRLLLHHATSQSGSQSGFLPCVLSSQVSLLYRSEAQQMMPAGAGAGKYSLQVADILPSIGIIHSMTTGEASEHSETPPSLPGFLPHMLIPCRVTPTSL